MQPFDKKLAERIQDVFESYDDGSADQGWAELRSKYPEKRRYRLLWIPAAVAAIALVAVTWLLVPASVDKANHPENQKAPAALGRSGEADRVPKNTGREQQHVIRDGNTAVAAAGRKTVAGGAAEEHVASRTSQRTAELTAVTTAGREHLAASTTRRTEAIPATGTLTKTDTRNQPELASSPDRRLTTTTPISDQLMTISVAPLLSAITQDKKAVPRFAVNSTLPRLPYADSLRRGADAPDVSRVTTSVRRKPVISAYGSGYATYGYSQNAGGSGLGIQLTFPLSKRFNVATGLALTGSSLEFSDVSYSSPLYADIHNTGSGNYADMSQQNAPSGAWTIVSRPAVAYEQFKFQFTELEVPLNFSFNVTPGRPGIYLGAGLSSYIFAKEKYFFNSLTVNSNAAGSYSSSNVLSDEQRAFKSVAPLGSLNLLIGIDLPVGKHTLTAEPFWKLRTYPVGQYHLRYNSLGVNVKFSLSK